MVTQLGAEDPEADGHRLSELEKLAAALHDQLADLDEPHPVQPTAGQQLGDEAAKGAARALGGTAVEKIVALAEDNWMKLELGLSLVWRTLVAFLTE